MLGRDIVEVIPAQTSCQQAAEIMARLRAGESWSGKFPVQRRDGTVFPALVTDVPIWVELVRLSATYTLGGEITLSNNSGAVALITFRPIPLDE